MKDVMVAWTPLGCQEEHAAKQVPRFRAWRSAWWIQPRTCGSGRFLHGCRRATILWVANAADASTLLLVWVWRESG